MKKRLLTAVLAVGVVLSLVGCGSQADTSTTATAESTTEYGTEETVVEEVATEEVAETEVVEETTVEEVTEETVVEEVNPEEAPVIKEASIKEVFNVWGTNNCVIQGTETDYITGAEKYIEYLQNAEDGVFACIDGENLGYFDLINIVGYVQGADNNSFIKMTDKDTAMSYLSFLYGTLFTQWMDTDFMFTEGSDGVNGEYIYAYQNFQNAEGTETYKVSYFINKETNLPFMQVISTTMPAESITVETDEALITGEEPVVREARFMYSYPIEGTEDFETFKAATTLPTDEECVAVE